MQTRNQNKVGMCHFVTRLNLCCCGSLLLKSFALRERLVLYVHLLIIQRIQNCQNALCVHFLSGTEHAWSCYSAFALPKSFRLRYMMPHHLRRPHCFAKRMHSDARLWTQGDTDKDIYIIKHGTIKVMGSGPDKAKVKVQLSTSTVLGVDSLINGSARNADCVADGEVGEPCL